MVPSWGNVIGGAGNVLDLHLGGSYRGGVHRGKCITLFSFRVLSIYIHIRVCNKVTCNLTSTRYLFPVTAAGLWGPGPNPACSLLLYSPQAAVKRKEYAIFSSQSLNQLLWFWAPAIHGHLHFRPPSIALMPPGCPGLLWTALPAGRSSSLESLHSPLRPSRCAEASGGRC